METSKCCITWKVNLKSSFRKFYGRYGDLIQQYEVSLSRMLNDILILDQHWLPNQSYFQPISRPSYRAWPSPIMSGFHGAFATDVACQQGTLTLPDTWFRPPYWGTCLCSNCWDQIPRTCHVFTLDFSPRIPLGISSSLLRKCVFILCKNKLSKTIQLLYNGQIIHEVIRSFKL